MRKFASIAAVIAFATLPAWADLPSTRSVGDTGVTSYYCNHAISALDIVRALQIDTDTGHLRLSQLRQRFECSVIPGEAKYRLRQFVGRYRVDEYQQDIEVWLVDWVGGGSAYTLVNAR